MLATTRFSRAAIYVRVSLPEQLTGFSVDTQISELRQYCMAHGIEIHDVYVDAGISGGQIAGRHELERLLIDADRKKYDVLIITRTSRLSRKLRDLLTIVDRLNQNDIKLISLKESFDISTPHGMLILQMIGASAELDRVNIADNVRAAMNHRSRRGIWNAGNSVLGYNWVRDPATNLGQVVVVAEEARLVNRIFEWYVSGNLGYKAITCRLNESGFRTKHNNHFSVPAVRSILKNGNYIGLVRLNKTEQRRTKGAVQESWVQGTHEAIVDRKLWDRVQAILQGRFASPVRTIERPFPLVGLLKCPLCGGSMVPWHVKRKRKSGYQKIDYYYFCGTYNAKGSTVCRANLIRADSIEQWFFDQLRTLLSSPETVAKLMTATNKKQLDASLPSSDEWHQNELRIKELAERQKQLFWSFESGQTSKEDFTSGIREVKTRLQEAVAMKERQDTAIQLAESSVVSREQVQTALSHVRRLFETSAASQQRQLLRSLVDKITVPQTRDLCQAKIHSSNALMNIPIPLQSEVEH